MKDAECYELFGGIALKNTHFHFFDFYKNRLEYFIIKMLKSAPSLKLYVLLT